MDVENTTALRDRFWENHPLDALNRAEWEALCDGCGKCCLIKLEDEKSNRLAYTTVACRLFDNATCKCTNYALRSQIVPSCVVLSPENIERNAYWMPKTCAYRRLALGQALLDWHPLLAGNAEMMHDLGHSMRQATQSETTIPESEWEEYIITDES